MIVVALVVMVAPLVLAPIETSATGSPSGSDQFVARFANVSFKGAPNGRSRVRLFATGGRLFVKLRFRFETPAWIPNWPPARSLLKEEMSRLKAAASKFDTLPEAKVQT